MKFKVDERCGCIAVVRTDIDPPSPGLHRDDDHVIAFWRGVNVTNRIYGQDYVCWHVPAFKVKQAKKLYKQLNKRRTKMDTKPMSDHQFDVIHEVFKALNPDSVNTAPDRAQAFFNGFLNGVTLIDPPHAVGPTIQRIFEEFWRRKITPPKISARAIPEYLQKVMGEFFTLTDLEDLPPKTGMTIEENKHRLGCDNCRETKESVAAIRLISDPHVVILCSSCLEQSWKKIDRFNSLKAAELGG